jgi:hypothetical protein
LIDREVDFFTPLFCQLTYEGLVDEVFGIENSVSFSRLLSLSLSVYSFSSDSFLLIRCS